MLDSETYDEISQRLYAELEPDMTPTRAKKIILKAIYDYDIDIEDPFDVVMVGILAGDVWRPFADEDDDEIDEDLDKD